MKKILLKIWEILIQCFLIICFPIVIIMVARWMGKYDEEYYEDGELW